MIDFPNPLNSAILHLPLTAHAFGNSLRNNCLLELFVIFNTGLKIVNYSIKLGTKIIEIANDS